jgi:arylsulfatase A-like enzyme
MYVKSNDLHEFVIRFLADYKEKDRPWAIFICSLDTHEPYFDRSVEDLREEEIAFMWKSLLKTPKRLSKYYEQAICYNDMTIGNLFSILKENGVYEQTFIVVLSDHGEAFYEHGFYGHRSYPFDELIHIPFMIKYPYSKFGGTRCDLLVQSVDLFATLIDYCDLPKPLHLHGKSLRGAIEKGDKGLQNSHVIFSEGPNTLCVRSSQWKYMLEVSRRTPHVSAKKETRRIIKRIIERDLWNLIKQVVFLRRPLVEKVTLFNLEKDPFEKKNVARYYPHVIREFSKYQQDYNEKCAQLREVFSHKKMDIDKAISRKLRALGYYG